MKKSYVVRFEKDRESGWWVVTVPAVPGCLTQGRSLAEGRRRIREALALFVDEATAARAALVDDVRLPAGMKDVVRQAASARVQLEKVRAEAVRSTTAAARALTGKVGLSVRDAAEMLGVSFQRVAQITRPHKAA